MVDKFVDWFMRVVLGVWPIPAAGEDISVFRWRRSMTFVVFAAYLLILAGGLLSMGYVAIRGFSGFADAATVSKHFEVEASDRASAQAKLDNITQTVTRLSMTLEERDHENKAAIDRNSMIGMRERECDFRRVGNIAAANLVLNQINMLQAEYQELKGVEYPLRPCS